MLSKAPITGIMDRLERDGLARRVVDRADRRVVRAVITEAGVRNFEEIKADFSEWKDRAFGGFSEAEKAMLAAILQRLLFDILAQPEGAPETY
jgi:DNA-binding MarR family transcriptional regulator